MPVEVTENGACATRRDGWAGRYRLVCDAEVGRVVRSRRARDALTVLRRARISLADAAVVLSRSDSGPLTPEGWAAAAGSVRSAAADLDALAETLGCRRPAVNGRLPGCGRWPAVVLVERLDRRLDITTQRLRRDPAAHVRCRPGLGCSLHLMRLLVQTIVL